MENPFASIYKIFKKYAINSFLEIIYATVGILIGEAIYTATEVIGMLIYKDNFDPHSIKWVGLLCCIIFFYSLINMFVQCVKHTITYFKEMVEM